MHPSSIAVITAAVLLCAIGLGPAGAAEADPRLAPVLVKLAVVAPATATERAFTGIVSARVQSNLGFRVAGKVIERLVDTGQRVQAGQPLMRLDPQDLGLAIEARDNAVSAAQALAVQAAADERRYRQLLADGWVTQQKYDQARATLDSANAQLAAARAQAQVARNEGGYALLLADADGTVVEALAEPGQVVAAGQIVVRLAHAGPREATVNLPEAIRPAIGSTATARTYAGAGGAYPAHLRQLSDAADPQSRTFEARYVLEGDAASAPLGATVTISIPTQDTAGITAVPVGALYDTGTTTGVWIVDPSAATVAFRPVGVRGLRDETALITGVAAGERVVALGAHLLRDGDKVRIAQDEVAAQ
jgi:RND family efflux transporter MFP subunit